MYAFILLLLVTGDVLFWIGVIGVLFGKFPVSTGLEITGSGIATLLISMLLTRFIR